MHPKVSLSQKKEMHKELNLIKKSLIITQEQNNQLMNLLETLIKPQEQLCNDNLEQLLKQFFQDLEQNLMSFYKISNKVLINELS
jgi:hypothetical protein